MAGLHRGAVTIALALAACGAHAQIVAPDRSCGPAVDDDEVLVIDLTSFADDEEGATEFLGSQLADREYELGALQTINLGRGPAQRFRNPFASALRLLQREAARRGCTLAVAISTWEEPIGVSSTTSTATTPTTSTSTTRDATVPFATAFLGTITK